MHNSWVPYKGVWLAYLHQGLHLFIQGEIRVMGMFNRQDLKDSTLHLQSIDFVDVSAESNISLRLSCLVGILWMHVDAGTVLKTICVLFAASKSRPIHCIVHTCTEGGCALCLPTLHVNCAKHSNRGSKPGGTPWHSRASMFWHIARQPAQRMHFLGADRQRCGCTMLLGPECHAAAHVYTLLWLPYNLPAQMLHHLVADAAGLSLH